MNAVLTVVVIGVVSVALVVNCAVLLGFIRRQVKSDQ
jgi:hypothetical protein